MRRCPLSRILLNILRSILEIYRSNISFISSMYNVYRLQQNPPTWKSASLKDTFVYICLRTFNLDCIGWFRDMWLRRRENIATDAKFNCQLHVFSLRIFFFTEKDSAIYKKNQKLLQWAIYKFQFSQTLYIFEHPHTPSKNPSLFLSL